MRKSSPEPPLTSPIPFNAGSNGEFEPPPLTAQDRLAEAMVLRLADQGARRLGISRRAYLESACGMAAALVTLNQVFGCGRGCFGVSDPSTLDAGRACVELSGDEFIVDVQTHHINPQGGWRQKSPFYELFFASLPQAACGERDAIGCLGVDNYVKEVFLDSDTSVAVLSAVPADPDANPLTADEQAATRDLVDRLAASSRLLVHGLVLPDRGAAQLDLMQRLAEDLKVPFCDPAVRPHDA